MTMEQNVHRILKDVGAAKGISQEEVYIWTALCNDAVFGQLKKELEREVARGGMSREELDTTLAALEQNRERAKANLRSYVQKIGSIQKDCLRRFVDHEIKQKEQEIKDLELLNEELQALLQKR